MCQCIMQCMRACVRSTLTSTVMCPLAILWLVLRTEDAVHHVRRRRRTRGQEDGPRAAGTQSQPSPAPEHTGTHEELGYYGYHSHLVSIYRISVRKAQKQLVIKCKAQRYGCVLQNVNKNNLVTCSILMQVRTTPPSLVLNKVHCTQHIVHNSQVSLICWFWFAATEQIHSIKHCIYPKWS